MSRIKDQLKDLFNKAPLTLSELVKMTSEQVQKRFFQTMDKKNIDDLKLILEQHPDAVNWRHPISLMPAIALAMNRNSMACFSLLLQYGADRNATITTTSSERLIHMALTNRLFDYAKMLASQGADITSPGACFFWSGDSRWGSYRSPFRPELSPLDQARRLSEYRHIIEGTKKDRAGFESVVKAFEVELERRNPKPALVNQKRLNP